MSDGYPFLVGWLLQPKSDQELIDLRDELTACDTPQAIVASEIVAATIDERRERRRS